MENPSLVNDEEEAESPVNMNQSMGKVLIQTSLYECLIYIQQALAKAGTMSRNPTRAQVKSRYASSSEEEGEEGIMSESDEQSDASSLDEPTAEGLPSRATTTTTTTNQPQRALQITKSPAKIKLEKLNERQADIRVRKYVDTLTCHSFERGDDPSSCLCLPVSLLSKDDRLAEHPFVSLQAFQKVAENVQSGKPIVVLFVRSGRFAGAVFVKGECVTHHTKTTYTVRKGQGKAQSAQDSQRRPKSIGSQLRRQGEEKLQEDITESSLRWKNYFDSAALILLSCPKAMKKSFFDSLDGVLTRDDGRIRRVPLDLGRPTFENAVLIHDVLTTVTIRQRVVQETAKRILDVLPTQATSGATPSETVAKATVTESPEAVEIPLSALHVACKNGDLGVIRDILASSTAELTVMAGPDLMTPLHFAADSTRVVEASQAAGCVSELLLQGHANPTLLDGRSRPPYFLASHDQVRDAFRVARSRLGESFCDWEAAKVGPPLTEDDLQKRKEKEAEKRKKKKAKQKQKKAQDKAAAEEMEARRKEEEEKARRDEEAKRIRDGLQLQTNKAGNVCDFCQTVCKGRKRNQMFKRLDYVYCSTECVQNHKRELMAKAALARFGG